MSAAPAGLCFPERETETQKCPGLKQTLISVWGGQCVPHAYVERCVRGFQSKYSSLSMDSVVVAILGDLMSPGDDSEEFICSWLALIKTKSLIRECIFTEENGLSVCLTLELGCKKPAYVLSCVEQQWPEAADALQKTHL